MSAKKRTVTIEVTEAQLNALGEMMRFYNEGHLYADTGHATPHSRGILAAGDRIIRALNQKFTEKAQPRRRPAD